MIGIYSSTTERWIFYIVLALLFLSEIIGSMIIPHLRRRGAKIKKNDKGSGLLFIIGMFAFLPIAYFFAKDSTFVLSIGIFYLGIIFIILGIIIRQWSIAVLGRFFSGTVGLQKNHNVVDRGPYRLVRHPSYTGIVLTLVGFGLAVQSWGAIIVILIISCALIYRIYVEEKVLVSNLGGAYIEYMKRTKRLIPYVL